MLNCKDLTHLPDNLPERLTTLTLDNCPNLTHSPENLPEGLTCLHVSSCNNLTHVPENITCGLPDKYIEEVEAEIEAERRLEQEYEASLLPHSSHPYNVSATPIEREMEIPDHSISQ